MLTEVPDLSLNFRRPREPVWNQYTGMFFDAKTDHISLPETQTFSRGKVSYPGVARTLHSSLHSGPSQRAYLVLPPPNYRDKGRGRA